MLNGRPKPAGNERRAVTCSTCWERAAFSGLWETTSIFLSIRVSYGFPEWFMDPWNVRLVTGANHLSHARTALYSFSQTGRVGEAPQLGAHVPSFSWLFFFWTKFEDLLISYGTSSPAAIHSELLRGSCPLLSPLPKLLEVCELQTHSLRN